jgi:hypothetical protein
MAAEKIRAKTIPWRRSGTRKVVYGANNFSKSTAAAAAR